MMCAWPFLIVFGVFAWWIFGEQGREGYPPFGHREDRAMRELRERYARGEITAEEYEERRRVLER